MNAITVSHEPQRCHSRAACRTTRPTCLPASAGTSIDSGRLTLPCYYARPHRNDKGKHAIISPSENVQVKLAAYKKVVDFQVAATSVGAC